MEGPCITSGKLRFVESRRKYRASQNVNSFQSYKLIAAANNHGLVILGFDDKTVKAVQTDQLLDFTQSKEKAEIVNLQQFNSTIQLTFKPTLLSVARHGYSSVLFVSGQDDVSKFPIIEAIDLDVQHPFGKLELRELAGSEIVDYAWHPNYYDSIVALCTTRGSLLVVVLNRKEKSISLVYNSQQYGALTCCWSPKGKNLAIGMLNGRILRLEPVITSNSFTFKEVDKSTFAFSHPKMTPDHQLTRLRWINKTFLMSVHAKQASPTGPETIHSVITVKPSKPYRYWTNICFENQNVPNYTVHLANLSNTVICASNASGEAAVIGVDGSKEARTNELTDWHSIIIDEEGARIELPLDNNNRETFPRGLTMAFIKNNVNSEVVDRPILIFYTNDGVICPYAAIHSENILKLPDFQQPQECPITIKSPARSESTHSFGGQAAISSGSLNLSTSSLGLTNPILTKGPFSGGTLTQHTFGSASLTQSPFGASSLLSGNSTLHQSPLQGFGASLASTFGSTQLSAGGSPMMNTFASISASVENQQPSIAKPMTQIQSSPPKPVEQIVPTPSKLAVEVTPSLPTAIAKQVESDSVVSLPASKKVEPEIDFGPKIEELKAFPEEIAAMKKKIEFNEVFLSLLDEINHLRNQFDEIQEIHKIHREVLDAIKEDIESLDIGMLENLYLIEYIKSRSKGVSRRKSLDPMTLKKVESIKMKTKLMAEKLKDLNDHVDLSWEDFVRRKTAMDNKERRLNSLDIIYKTLATNQKIINELKKRAAAHPGNSPKVQKQTEVYSESSLKRRTLDPVKLRAFREFLSSRSIVPVRRPELVKQTSRRLQFEQRVGG